MPEDQLNLLLQRIRYFEKAQAIQRADYLSNKSKYDAIVNKLKSMVNSGEITTYLAIDSIYHHLLEKLDEGELDLGQSVSELRDFVN